MYLSGKADYTWCKTSWYNEKSNIIIFKQLNSHCFTFCCMNIKFQADDIYSQCFFDRYTCEAYKVRTNLYKVVCIDLCHSYKFDSNKKKKKNSNEQIQVKEDRVLYHSI
ncbi:hypothetical protein ACB098_05G137400 [Castanea mollissima]